jgi:hypothetical protein
MYTRDALTDFEASYMETALWSETDDVGNPLDGPGHDEELAEETIVRIKRDCESFNAKALPLFAAYNEGSDAASEFDMKPSRVAHDFWLTRNRHGAGFWDGDYPEPLGTQLTDLAHEFGEVNLYIGDDGKLYLA